MKAAIVGAGAIGGWIAGLLADAGQNVSLYARGATLAALKANGLTVRRAGKDTVYRLRASNDPAELGPQDCVVVAVKGQAMVAVAPAVAALCGKDTMVVPALNGIPWWFFHVTDVPLSGTMLSAVDAEGVTARCIEAERVVGCVVHASAWSRHPGFVAVQGEDRLILGEPDGRSSARLAVLASAFGSPAVKVVASEAIRRDIWTKLWGNMTMNPLSVLTGATTLAMLSDPGVRGLVRAMMLEMQEMGTALGLPIPMTPEDRMEVTRRLGDIKTSMLRDWEARRGIELAPILGTLIEIADRLRRPAPFLRAVEGLVRLRANRF